MCLPYLLGEAQTPFVVNLNLLILFLTGKLFRIQQCTKSFVDSCFYYYKLYHFKRQKIVLKFVVKLNEELISENYMKQYRPWLQAGQALASGPKQNK